MGDSLYTLIDTLNRRLVSRGETITVVESCTGGALASALTGVSGSSQWFRLGLVTYADQFKRELLGVTKESLEHEGAVSEVVVREMVTGAMRLAHADYGIAISGIAGPGGGNRGTPAGNSRGRGRGTAAPTVLPSPWGCHHSSHGSASDFLMRCLPRA